MAVKNTSLFLGRPKKILSAHGVWPHPNNFVILRKLYMLFIMWTQYSFLLFEIIYIADVWGDIDAVSEASYLLFTQASLCYKSTAFMVNKQSLLELLEIMDCEIFEPKSAEHKKILAAQARKIKRLCLFFLTSATTTCTLWAMIPLFDAASKRSFPFRIWMPVTPLKSPDYELGYLYQMVSIYISAFLFISVDSVAVSMIMFGCAQLEIIMDKIQKIKYVFESADSEEGRRKIIKTNNEFLVECIKQHQTVERFIQLCEDTYHANIFFQLTGTVAIICNIGLRISIVEPNSVQFFSMVNYMVTMLSQLFLYCWCGHELTIRSENLREWLYQCPWYEQDTKFKRALFIAMERMKKPIIFKAGHYISLSRPTFVAILRCSYSYFAVLNRVNTE
uniref:Odorant receptor n=1 Tax=Helicoverpa assulta TaxID=52344 RepID=R4JNS8_HELAU|nr:olfactory receptor 10 [Helicoverpa assulta]